MLEQWNQYKAVFSCALSVFSSGVGFNWMSPLMERMDDLFTLDPSEASWAVSSIEYGEIISSIPAGIFADMYGRKWVLLSSGLMGLLGWLLLLISKSVIALYAARILHGLMMGVVFSVVPLYIAEVAEPRVRGALAGQFQTMWAAGLLFNYLIGPYTSLNTYLYLCVLPLLLFTVTFAFMPETPYFLIMKEREDAGVTSLVWLRGLKTSENEIQEMKSTVWADMKNKGSWRDLFASSKDRKIFFTVQLVCFSKYMIGSPSMSSYAAKTFASYSGGAIGEHEATIAYGSVLLFSAVFGSLLSDSVGRRPLLVWTCFGMGVCYCFTSVYFYLAEVTDILVESYVWVMYLSIGLAAVLANIGPSALVQTVQGELFPSNTRAIGGALTGITASISTFLDLKQYQTLLDLFGLYSNFVVFACFAFGGSLLIYCLFKETAGKSLGQIQSDMTMANAAEL